MCRSRGIALLLIGANATLLALELVLDDVEEKLAINPGAQCSLPE